VDVEDVLGMQARVGRLRWMTLVVPVLVPGVVGLALVAGGPAPGTPAASTPATTPAPAPPVTGPGGVTVEQGITYQLDNGPPGTPLQPELLDAYLPAPRPGVTAPAVVLVHGGGWAGGSRTVLRPEAQQLAQQGWAAFTVDYRLEGDPNQLPWNDELDDVQAAVRSVAAHANRFDLDPSRIGLIGASAGGHLVALVATLGTLDDTTGHDQNAVPGAKPVNPVVVATWSGVFDLGQLASIAGSPPTGCAGDPACIGIFLPHAIPTYVGCPEINCEARYAEASPLTHVSASTPPMFIANSQEELIPLQQPDEMIAALQRFGVPNRLDILPGELHAQEYAPQVMQPTVAFMQTYLEPATTGAVSRAASGDGGDEHRTWSLAAVAGLIAILGLMAFVAARGRRARSL
jgi:acetyl esterase/lipase